MNVNDSRLNHVVVAVGVATIVLLFVCFIKDTLFLAWGCQKMLERFSSLNWFALCGMPRLRKANGLEMRSATSYWILREMDYYEKNAQVVLD